MSVRTIERLHEDKAKRTIHVFSSRGYELTVPAGLRDRLLRLGATLDDEDVERLKRSGREFETSRHERHQARAEQRAAKRPAEGEITRLEPGRRARIFVYLDEIYAFAVSPSQVTAEDLRVGRSLTADDVTRLMRGSSVERVGEMIDRLAGFRPRTAGEIRERLKRKGISGEVVEAAIESRLRRGIIYDDEAFVAWFLVARGVRKGKGFGILVPELRRLSVSNEAIESARGQYEATEALTVAATKASRGLDLTDRRSRQRFVERLVRHGFRYSDAKSWLDAQAVGDDELNAAADEEDTGTDLD